MLAHATGAQHDRCVRSGSMFQAPQLTLVDTALELHANDPMADVKEAAIALGNVYRRAGDARLRLAARVEHC